MLIRSNIVREAAPKGKRTVRENRWGNTNGYIAGRFWKTIGPTYAVGTAAAAQDFLEGKDET